MRMYKIVVLIFVVIYFTSCVSAGKLGENPDDLSFPVVNAQALEEGVLYFKKTPVSIWEKEQDFSLLSDGIICDGNISFPTLNAGITNTIFGYVKEYHWKGAIRYERNELNKVRIDFTVISHSPDGGNGFDKKIEFSKTITGDTYVFRPNTDVRIRMKEFDIPFLIADFETQINTYSIYAVYADVWLNKDEQILSPDLVGKILQYERLVSVKQKYQIISEDGTVVAELKNDTYTIYDSADSEDIGRIKTCIGILYSLIQISDTVLSTNGWLNT